MYSKKTDIFNCFNNIFKNNWDLELIIDDNRSITYGKFFTDAFGFVNYLIKQNIKKQSKIVIKIDNSYEYLVAIMACLLGGYVACPINSEIDNYRYNQILKIIKPSFVIDNIKKVNIIKTNTKLKEMNISESDFLIIFTSGTTGLSKGILFDSKKFLLSAKSFAELTEYNENTIVYHCLPMFYMAGILNTFFSCIFSKSKIYLATRVSLLNIVNLVNRNYSQKPNSIHLTPPIFKSLMTIEKNKKSILDHFSDYQSIISTASYLYPEIQEEFYNRYKKRILSCYGLTELGGPLTIQSWEDSFEDTNVGKHNKDVKIKIKNVNKMKSIFIKTKFMMKSYITLKGFEKLHTDKHGYFETGDVGEYKNGILFINGRTKDLIKKGGEIVSLNYIENISMKFKNVIESSAVGKDNINTGEDVILFVKYNKIKDLEIENKKLFDFLKSKLRTIEMPVKIIPVPLIPKTSNNKTIKNELLKLYSI